MFLPIERVKVVSSCIKLFLASCIKLFLASCIKLFLASCIKLFLASCIKLFLASCIKLFLTLSNNLLLARIDAIEALRCNLVSLLGPNAAGKTNVLHILRIKLDLSVYCNSCVDSVSCEFASNNVSYVCNATFLSEVGKKTPMLGRWSTNMTLEFFVHDALKFSKLTVASHMRSEPFEAATTFIFIISFVLPFFSSELNIC